MECLLTYLFFTFRYNWLNARMLLTTLFTSRGTKLLVPAGMVEKYVAEYPAGYPSTVYVQDLTGYSFYYSLGTRIHYSIWEKTIYNNTFWRTAFLCLSHPRSQISNWLVLIRLDVPRLVFLKNDKVSVSLLHNHSLAFPTMYYSDNFL